MAAIDTGVDQRKKTGYGFADISQRRPLVIWRVERERLERKNTSARNTELGLPAERVAAFRTRHNIGFDMSQLESFLRPSLFRMIRGMETTISLPYSSTSAFGCRCKAAIRDSCITERPQPSDKSVHEDIHGDTAMHTLRLRSHGIIFHATEDLRQIYFQSYAKHALGDQGKGKRFKVDEHASYCVALTPIVKPVEAFGSLEELLKAMKDYSTTIIALQNHGLVHSNISLENLSITVTAGNGVITSFDDRGDHSDRRKYRPYFIRTMPARLLAADSGQCLSCCDSLESLFLSLIWIVTTRSGPCNQRRANSGGYKFRDTELYKWSKHDWNSKSKNLSRVAYGKQMVMCYRTRFEQRVLDFVHPFFAELSPCLRALRALLFDPQWKEFREKLAKLESTDYYTRAVLIGMFIEALEGERTSKEPMAERAEAKLPMSDRNTVLGLFDQRSGTIRTNHDIGFDVSNHDTYQHASIFRFIRGRKTTTFLTNSATLAIGCEATDGAPRTADRSPTPYHACSEDFDEETNEHTASLKARAATQGLHVTGFMNHFYYQNSACLVQDGQARGEILATGLRSEDSRCKLIRLLARPLEEGGMAS